MYRRIACTFLFTMATIGCLAQEVLVAAASDLKFAMDSVITVFEKQNNGRIKITYGSSGKLCEQIMHGAPFDIFFSADIAYPRQLKSKGLTATDIHAYATGTLVLWSKKMDTRKGMPALLDPSIKKIAIANPAHAPYGKRAVESLQYHKVYAAVQPKLVYGENISQTAQFVSTGAADMGIIALSLALSPNMARENGNYTIIDAGSHQPLVQGAVVTANGKSNKLAFTFFDFIKSREALAILQHFGFTKP